MEIDVNKMSDEDIRSILKEAYNVDVEETDRDRLEEILELMIEERGEPDEDVLADVDFGDAQVVEDKVEDVETEEIMNPGHPDWTKYILDEMTDNEKVNGNPTTDGLRRVLERTLGLIEESRTEVISAPTVENERRATVKVTLSIRPKEDFYYGHNFVVDGVADVYWGNTEKPYRNYPVATAETRAEGRALRRALRLSKVLVAEEISEVVDHDYESIDNQAAGNITDVQVKFIEQMCKRYNLNVKKVVNNFDPKATKVRDIKYNSFNKLQEQLGSYQRDMDSIPEELKGYDNDWQSKE